MKLIKSILLIFPLLLFVSALFAADPVFTVAGTIKSNLVVQRGKPFIVWGTAGPGEQVRVTADWQKRSFTVNANEKGEWTVSIDVPDIVAGDVRQHQLTIKSGSQVKNIKNILFGDVWLCSGQSNMDMTIKPFLPWLLGAVNYQLEIDNADFPMIRLFDVRTDFKAVPEADCQGEWKICTPDNAADFSALAYFFARELFNKTGIPQGLITSAVGASSCEAWTGRKALEADKVLFDKYLFPYDTSARSKEPLDSVVTFEKVVRPTLFYNAMIYPLRNVQFSGALWYQGESNRNDGALYTRLCGAMISDWRNLFNNDSLPFYLVQVAPYNWGKNDTTEFEYALLREAQDRITSVVPHTGIALTMDIADPTDIHPRNKQDVGYRLAKVALSQKYMKPDVVYRGPEYLSHTVVGDSVFVKFKPETIGSGLQTNDGLAPQHFFLTGGDNKYFFADAIIVGDEVHLHSRDVKQPKDLRYAFTNYPVTNFGNAEGFPGVPFRTDTLNQLAKINKAKRSRVSSHDAPAWSEMLRRDSGWIGADGIYAVPLNGVEKPGVADSTETLIWFSDNIWGKITDDTLADNWEMAHNCVAFLKGGEPNSTHLEFFGREDGKSNTATMFEPHTPNTKEGDYYWLGDGFFNHVIDSTIYIFAYRIRNVPGGIYPFDDVGLSLIALPKGSRPPFKNQRQKDVPFFLKDSRGRGKVVFGINVLANTVGAGAPNPDGYIYVYGVRGPFKELIVARVPDKAFENFAEWRFWNGKGWGSDIHECAALTNRISNEMSVSFMEDGRVISVYQLDTNSPDIMMQVAKTPWGPFQPAKKIWFTDEIYDDIDMYTYNAKAHPHLSKPGELLISYNVNSFDFADDIKYHPHHLRPRFFTLKYK